MRRILVCGIALLTATLACGPFGGASEEAVQAAIAQTEVAATEIQADIDTAVEETAAALSPAEAPAATQTTAPATDDLAPVTIRSHVEVGSDEQRYVIGEVVNDGAVDVHFVKIIANFYDAAGNDAGSDFTYTKLNRVPAGGRSPFSLATHVAEDVNPDWASYELAVEWQEVTGECYMCYAEFEVLEETLTQDSRRVRTEGVLSNVGPSDAERVQITVTYYDESDNVVGMGFTFADEDVVPAGGSSAFSIILYTGLPTVIDHYALYVEGTEL